MSAPVVALVGINGLLGKQVVPTFVESAKTGDFASLRLLARSETDLSRKSVEEGAGKVSVVIINYDDKSTLTAALKGVDVLVSAVGWGPDQAKSAQALLEAAVESGVKVYFNSDFGSDYDYSTFGSPLFDGKKQDREAAEKLGLKTVAIATGGFTETSFAYPFFGASGDTWTISGDGTTPFAVTALVDIGKYTARAVVIAHQKPSEIPRRLRVYSELKSWNEYADIKEKITGKKIERVYVPREELVKQYETGNESIAFVLRLVADTPAADFTGVAHNELLNPGHKYFVPQTYESYIKSTL